MGKASVLQAPRQSLPQAGFLTYCHNVTLGRGDSIDTYATPSAFTVASDSGSVFRAVSAYVEDQSRDRLKKAAQNRSLHQ